MSSTSVEAVTQFRACVDELLAPLPLAARTRMVWRLAWTVTEIHEAYAERITAAIADLNDEQRGRRSWHAPTPEVTESGQLLRTVPCWPSRRAWLAVVCALLADDVGNRARRRHHRVAASTVIRTAQILAQHADSATGRHCKVSIEAIARAAGLSVEQVKNARAVLRRLGMFVDVQFGRHLTGLEIRAARAHHGGTQRAMASEVALTVPREHASLIPPRLCTPSGRRKRSTAQPRRQCTPLTSCGSEKSLELAQETGNSQEDQTKRTVRRRRSHPHPRPLALQRLVAGVLARARGLDDVTDALQSRAQPVPPSWRSEGTYQRERHLGRICDAFVAAGIDPDVWTAAAVTRRLDLHARSHGWTWPTAIHNPSAYLRWRLTQLEWTTPAPSRSDGCGIADQQTNANDLPTAARRRDHLTAIAAACGWTPTRHERSAEPIA
ncbi:hypothetical protein [Gordonia sputi]